MKAIKILKIVLIVVVIMLFVVVVHNFMKRSYDDYIVQHETIKAKRYKTWVKYTGNTKRLSQDDFETLFNAKLINCPIEE